MWKCFAFCEVLNQCSLKEQLLEELGKGPMCVYKHSQSTSIQVWGEAVLKHWQQLKSHSILSPSSVLQCHWSKVTWMGEPNTRVPTLLSRSHREFWATVQVTSTVPPGVSEEEERPWGVMYRKLGREVRHPCSQGPVFSCTQLQPTWFRLVVPGDRTDPERAGASSPDNLSALIERQRVSAEWLYWVGIDFSSLCLRLVSVSFGGGYCYYKQHESCLC